MSWRLFAGWLLFYLLVILISGVASDTYMSSNQTSIISTLLQPQMPAYTNPVGGITSMFSVTAAWVSAFMAAISLDFPIFSGAYQILRLGFLTFIMGGLVYLVITGVRQS